jgi:hypothetical protein
LAFGSGGLHNASHDEEDRHMAWHPTRNDLCARTRGKARDALTANQITGVTGDVDTQLRLVEAHRQADS